MQIERSTSALVGRCRSVLVPVKKNTKALRFHDRCARSVGRCEQYYLADAR
jgi:hypothetical protein